MGNRLGRSIRFSQFEAADGVMSREHGAGGRTWVRIPPGAAL